VYRRYPPGEFPLIHMALVQWLRLSQALACSGFKVDVIADPPADAARAIEHVGFLPIDRFRPASYDVIVAILHFGYETLAAAGGAAHPFIISHLGSVVGGVDGIPGVHFLGEERRSLYEVQEQIQRSSRYVAVMTEPSKQLWEAEFGPRDSLLLVPTAAESKIPAPRDNPYHEFHEKIAVYIGNLYTDTQGHINLHWQRRLNALGRRLKRRGIRLCVLGPGNTEELDRTCVTYLGAVDNSRVWDYHFFADVGIVLAQGEVQHNESSKIYYYLRAGLPVVSEAPVPNNFVIQESGLGLISEYGDDRGMAEMIEAAIHKPWPRKAAIAYVLERHTWEKRAQVFAEIIRRDR
jgi:glycosyltransferase involved in cell wall biosynthesis